MLPTGWAACMSISLSKHIYITVAVIPVGKESRTALLWHTREVTCGTIALLSALFNRSRERVCECGNFALNFVVWRGAEKKERGR